MKCEYCDSIQNSQEQILCPQCGSVDITAVADERCIGEYRLYRSIAAKLLIFVEKIMHAAFREVDGQECVCLHCGYKWYPKKLMLAQQYKKHLANLHKSGPQLVVPTVDGFDLCFDSYGVVIYRKNKYKLGIPYNQITAVRYQKSVGPLYGWLSIRYGENQNRPFPASYEEAQKDKSTFVFDFSYSNTYLEIYTALDGILQENKRLGSADIISTKGA